MTPAPVTVVIHGARPVVAQIGDDELHRRHAAQQRLEPHAQQRREVAARQLPPPLDVAHFARHLRVAQSRGNAG